jgi:hypothetical protein
LQPDILAALKIGDAAQPATLEAASHAVQDLFDQARTPQDIAQAIARTYAAMAGEAPANAGGNEVGHVVYDAYGAIVQNSLPATLTDRLFTGVPHISPLTETAFSLILVLTSI